jgi:hypothetical protein
MLFPRGSALRSMRVGGYTSLMDRLGFYGFFAYYGFPPAGGLSRECACS